MACKKLKNLKNVQIEQEKVNSIEDGRKESIKIQKKKTKGRVKIETKYIQNKLRRYTTFSKRKAGIMKKVCFFSCLKSFIRSVKISSLKAYELSVLTGTQVMLLVASETGHVYTFATKKLQPMITSETGKNLIHACLSPTKSSNENVATSNSNKMIEIENQNQEFYESFEWSDSDNSIDIEELKNLKLFNEQNEEGEEKGREQRTEDINNIFNYHKKVPYMGKIIRNNRQYQQNININIITVDEFLNSF